MQITALGHSCVLLSFQQGDPRQATNILVDPWLSDHATGDVMGRFPRLRFSVADLPPLHAVYLSHAHCDHLDPYTLVRLWAACGTPPTLVLPVSLSFLVPVFQEYLDGVEIILLAPHTPTAFRGLELLGFFDVGLQQTNEDDVMVLVVTNGAERVLVEADARLSLELPGFREYVSSLMRAPELDSAVYLSTENELTGTMESRYCETTDDREALQEAALAEMMDAVSVLYEPVDDPDDLWQGERVLRLLHGQGLAATPEQDPRWQRILFPVRIADRLETERMMAEHAGCLHSIDMLQVGCVHTIEAGNLAAVAPASGLAMLDDEAERAFDPHLPFFPPLACAPLRADPRDRDAQRSRMEALLNTRFLPHLHGLRDPPVLHLLAAHGGSYRIRIQYGSQLDEDAQDYVLRFSERRFVAEDASGTPQEAYWANDLEDFLDGRCDEFSTSCRKSLPAEAMRLWASLAAPLLNSDLVRKRVALHFARASQGLSPGSWVTELLRPERRP